MMQPFPRVEFVMGFQERESKTHTTKFALMAALSCPPWTKQSGEYCFIIYETLRKAPGLYLSKQHAEPTKLKYIDSFEANLISSDIVEYCVRMNMC